jgi:hypothetical protein
MAEAESLVISSLIEGPIAFSIVRLTRWPSRGALHAGLASVIATAVTHPQLWPTIIVLEALVVVVEGLPIAWMIQLTPRRAMLVSLVANLASFLPGLLIEG